MILCFVACAMPPDAVAFKFSDGTITRCVADGRQVPEVELGKDAPASGFTGRTERTSEGYQIVWNPSKLGNLPPEMHDYLFFHECAHAHVPTRDEIAANCVGLKDMRGAGRAGTAIEARIAAFYGAGSGYWTKTLECANAGEKAPTMQANPPRQAP